MIRLHQEPRDQEKQLDMLAMADWDLLTVSKDLAYFRRMETTPS